MPIDVLANLLVRRPAGRRAEVATSPEVASPVPPSQMLKPFLQDARRPTFHLLHHNRWTKRRWTRHQYVHVIFADVTALDLHLQRKTRLPNQRPRSPCHFTRQYVIAILGHPHEVVPNIVYAVRTASVVRHAASGKARSLCKNSLPIRYVLKRLV